MACLKLEDTNDRLELEDKTEYILGRLDEPSGSYPDIDLDPFGGQDAGVSRRHARLILLGNGLNYIMDLSSTNGTLLNREPLEPLRHALLKDSDRIELGELKLAFIEHSTDHD